MPLLTSHGSSFNQHALHLFGTHQMESQSQSQAPRHSEDTQQTPLDQRFSGPFSSTSGSAVENILQDRKERTRGARGPMSSPISTRAYQRSLQNTKIRNIKDNQRQNQFLSRRGGLGNMEQFVMQGEYQREQDELKREAKDHELSLEMAEFLESDNKKQNLEEELMQMWELEEQNQVDLNQNIADGFNNNENVNYYTGANHTDATNHNDATTYNNGINYNDIMNSSFTTDENNDFQNNSFSTQ